MLSQNREAFPVRGQDVGMMGQPVQQGPGQLPAAKHLWPLREVQVVSHDERLPLIALRHHLEEELGSITGRISVVVLSAPGLHRSGPPKCSNTLANFWSEENFAGPILWLYDPFPGLYRGDARDIGRAKPRPPESNQETRVMVDYLKPNSPRIAANHRFSFPQGLSHGEAESFFKRFLHHQVRASLQGINRDMGIRR